MVPTFKFSPVFKNRVAAIAQHDEAPTETTTQQPIVAQQPIVQQQPIVAQQPVVEMQPGVAQQPVLEMQPTPHKTLWWCRVGFWDVACNMLHFCISDA